MTAIYSEYELSFGPFSSPASPLPRSNQEPRHSSVTLINTNTTTSPPRTGLSFLHLPLEIRQQIYHHVLEAHPRHERSLFWYPSRQVHNWYVTAPVRPKKDCSDSENITPTARRPAGQSPPRLFPFRGVGYMPQALLRANRQIYHECRLVPFERNEFVFDTWMSSSQTYCAAFLKGLREWQREATRYVMFDLSGCDLTDESGSLDLWVGLCGLWAKGVRGLRIRVGVFFMSGGFKVPYPADGRKAGEDWGGRMRWIREGLGRLDGLRQLEIEINIMPDFLVKVDDGDKVEWCERVEEVLNEGREEERKVRVLCVEKVPDGVPGRPLLAANSGKSV